MKYLLTLLFIASIGSIQAQNILKFDKRNVQCEDKWVAYQMNKDSLYSFGFIYIDATAGLTLNYEGDFKIDKTGKFNRIKQDSIREVGFMKVRLEPNRVVIAEIPESKFTELKIEKTPKWLANYKTDENSVNRLYKWGFMYNGWNECEKALTYLEKAEKIEPNYNGLQTELAFSYNALKKYESAEICLLKAIKNNPNDCYTYKELAYSYNHQGKTDDVIKTYFTMVKTCKEENYIQETAYNLAFKYYETKDKVNFKKWKMEAEKWSKTENQFTKYLKLMETELNK
jgi:tetratricopeptide (TPR) repeat protein